jgi:hypothetical protein
MTDVVTVHYAAGRAVVEMGERSVLVERRDTADRAEGCPLEWLSVSLGS